MSSFTFYTVTVLLRAVQSEHAVENFFLSHIGDFKQHDISATTGLLSKGCRAEIASFYNIIDFRHERGRPSQDVPWGDISQTAGMIRVPNFIGNPKLTFKLSYGILSKNRFRNYSSTSLHFCTCEHYIIREATIIVLLCGLSRWILLEICNPYLDNEKLRMMLNANLIAYLQKNKLNIN